MAKRGWIAAAIVAATASAMLLVGGPAIGQENAATAPTTLPSTRPAAPPYISRIMQRMNGALTQLDLSDDQKQQIKTIMDDARQQAEQIAGQIQTMSDPQRRQTVGSFLRDLRQKLRGVLTDDQANRLSQIIGSRAAQAREALRAAMNQLDLSDDQRKQIDELLAQQDQQSPQSRPTTKPAQNPLDQMQSRQEMRARLMEILSPEQQQKLRDIFRQRMQAAGNQTASSQPDPQADSNKDDVAAAPKAPPGPEVGATAPDFHISSLSGQKYDLATFKGHVVVIEFGSLSCPSFRQTARSMEKLYQSTRWRAWIMIVYTRENFPSTDHATPRNVSDKISIPQAKDLQERKTEAETARDQLQISLPVAVDSMDNAMVDAYGGFPNGAIVIDKHGTIVARQQWTNADSLRRAIEQALKN